MPTDDEILYKKPDANPNETYFQLAYTEKTVEEMHEIIGAMNTESDRAMLEVIFKKCKHHEIRIRVGRIIYYGR